MNNYKKHYNKLYKKPYQSKLLDHWKGYNEHLKLATTLVEGDKILDIGCGEGIITHRLKGKEIHGLDVSSNALKYAKNQNKDKNRQFIVGSAFQIPYKDNTFDSVSAFEVIEHITPQDMHKCLKEIKRTSKDGGKIVISTPNLSSIHYASIRAMRIQSKEHINEMDFIQIINIMSQYFTIDSIHTHTGSTWLRTAWLTTLVSSLQDIFLKLFPPMRSLFYSQIYLVMTNTKNNRTKPAKKRVKTEKRKSSS